MITIAEAGRPGAGTDHESCLDKKSCRRQDGGMAENQAGAGAVLAPASPMAGAGPSVGMEPVAVIDDPAAAEVSLDPMRARLLAALAEPGSASTLAAHTGLARQKINYHLRALERHGLIELVEERKRGNCTERVLR